MTLDDFIAAQQKLIAENGFEEYLPVLWVETRWRLKVNVLHEAPEGSQVEAIARDWALRMSGTKSNYGLAFKIDASRLKVVGRFDGHTSERTVSVSK